MAKYIVTATSTTSYYLEVEANSEADAIEQVKYKSSDNWISNEYQFDIGYAVPVE